MAASRIINIIAFDQTITKYPTHEKRCLERYLPNIDSKAITLAGEFDARANIRRGIDKAAICRFDSENIFVIATYHNNPDFIAGYVQFMLGGIAITPRLTAAHESVCYRSTTANLAIKCFDVAGSKKPLLIAYIPEIDKNHKVAVSTLHGKNDHIQFIQETLCKIGLMSPTDTFALYDHNPKHCELAQKLDVVCLTHQVHVSPEDEFSICHSWQRSHAAAATVSGHDELESAKASLRATGFVQSATLSRRDSEHLARALPGLFILRDSSSRPGMIACTMVQKDSSVRHIELTSVMVAQPEQFSTSQKAIDFLQTRLQASVATSLDIALVKAKTQLRQRGLLHCLNQLRSTILARQANGRPLLWEAPTAPHLLFVGLYSDGCVTHRDVTELFEKNLAECTTPDEAFACLQRDYSEPFMVMDEIESPAASDSHSLFRVRAYPGVFLASGAAEASAVSRDKPDELHQATAKCPESPRGPS